MWSIGLIGAGAALAALFFAWPVLGDGTVPISAWTLHVRIGAAAFLSASLVVWDVRRRHALGRIAEVHGIRVAETPSRATGAIGSALLIAVVASFVLDQKIAYEALVIRNRSEARREGVLAFIERYPRSDLMDRALDMLLADPDYLDSAAKAFPLISPDLRGRAANRILSRIVTEPPQVAGRALAEFVRAFEGADWAAQARRAYIGDVVPHFLARADLPAGVRALLKSLAEPGGGPRVGLVLDPPAAPAAIETLAGRLGRTLEGRTPFQVVRRGGDYVPRRIEIKWGAEAGKTRIDVRLFSTSGRGAPGFEARYGLPGLPDAIENAFAVDKVADQAIRDLLPPP